MKHLALLTLVLLAVAAGYFVYTTDPIDSRIQTTSSNTEQSDSNFDNVRFYKPSRVIPEFYLQTASGDFQLENFNDHWTILFLGYMSCPDICPTTLQNLARVYPELKRQNENLQVLLVSADPQRDTPENLQTYTQFFHSDFMGATAEHKHLLPFTQSIGLVYSMSEGLDKDSYLVNHSASLLIIDPEGRLAATIKPDFSINPPSINYGQITAVLSKLK